MSTTIAMVAALAALLASAGTPSDGLRYWGKARGGSNRGRVQYRGQFYSVREGDEIPGWGRIKAVADDVLVVSRALGDDEKRARAAAGLVVVDVQDVRIPNASGNLAARATGAGAPDRGMSRRPH